MNRAITLRTSRICERLSSKRLQTVTSILLAMFGGAFSCVTGLAEDRPTTFERVFGVPGVFDPGMVEKVRSLPIGERLWIDRNGDGKNDEVWFVDASARHTAARSPIVVRVLDEDGDLDLDGPDLDSDIYFADWRSDGIIDGVVDYQDNDSDGDVDEMGIYFGVYQQPWTDKDHVKVWWSQDIGDDNLLWYDTDWNYEQDGCQYRTHFGGDEVFYQFSLTKDANEWLNVFEDPFAFYDPDGDGCSEVVMRICAVGHDVSSLRYSLDIDNDAHGRHTHDYDFSITALAANDAIKTSEDSTASLVLRDIPVHPVLSWENARQFAHRAAWSRTLLTWDEMNANTEVDVQHDPHERWEGVINHASSGFPAVGGPPTSALNKRNEIAESPAAPLRLYYDVTDHRLHLIGAGSGWLDVDADLDGKVDARYTYFDEDRDGFFDRRQLDLDGGGKAEFDWPMQGKRARSFDLEYEPLHTFYAQTLERTLADSQAFIDAAKRVLGDQHRRRDPAEVFWLEQLPGWMPEARLGERMSKTPAGARFYLDLIRDRLFLDLSRRFPDHAAWDSVSAAYRDGDYGGAAVLVETLNPLAQGEPADAFRSYTRRIPIRIDNMGRPQRHDWPVVLAVANIQSIDPEFSPDQCALVAPERWIQWRRIPHQVDQVDDRIGEEISFLADIAGDSATSYYLYYAPMAPESAGPFSPRTGAAKDWIPPNIGWESNRIAYRAHGGQFDFFGKKNDQLIYGDIGAASYHQEVEWGIDALHVGKTSGLGGVTLYEADEARPVQNRAGEQIVQFSRRILARGPIRSAVEIVATNVIPENAKAAVQLRCLIYHEHQETEIRAELLGGLDASDSEQQIYLAPGIAKLPREVTFDVTARGCYGTSGWQEDVIGEIGLGLIVSPDVVHDVCVLPEERRVRCRPLQGGQLRYWLIGDWRRGRKYPVAPTVDNWRGELEELADLLLHDVDVELGAPEDVQ